MSTPLRPEPVGPMAQRIEQVLREALQPTQLQVRDDSAAHAGHAGAREGGHFHVRIRAESLAGLSRVARHRLVYHALRDVIPQGVHAMSIDAGPPGQA